MNQIKIGKFIAACRKEVGFTQASLAEELGITDRAVSKWERGNCLPDASLMVKLCGLLHITVNELLTGERIAMEKYQSESEKNMVSLKAFAEGQAKLLLNTEIVLGVITCLSFLVMFGVGLVGIVPEVHEFGVTKPSPFQLPLWVGILLIATSVICFCLGIWWCLFIEKDAGYYECPLCKNRYSPSIKEVFLAPHMFRTRYLNCPRCGQSGWSKKVISQEPEEKSE